GSPGTACPPAWRGRTARRRPAWRGPAGASSRRLDLRDLEGGLARDLREPLPDGDRPLALRRPGVGRGAAADHQVIRTLPVERGQPRGPVRALAQEAAGDLV